MIIIMIIVLKEKKVMKIMRNDVFNILILFAFFTCAFIVFLINSIINVFLISFQNGLKVYE